MTIKKNNEREREIIIFSITFNTLFSLKKYALQKAVAKEIFFSPISFS